MVPVVNRMSGMTQFIVKVFDNFTEKYGYVLRALLELQGVLADFDPNQKTQPQK